MEFCHTELFLHSPAAQRLLEFIRKRPEKWVTQTDLCGVDNFENFEQELHRLVMALQCELVREELSQYDISEKEIEVDSQQIALINQTTYSFWAKPANVNDLSIDFSIKTNHPEFGNVNIC